MRKQVDLLIVGGGAAGMAAALGAYSSGVRDILILEREAALGGILKQCIHNGFGLHRFKEELTGPEYAARDMKRIDELGITALCDTTVLSFSPSWNGPLVIAVNSTDGIIEFHCKALILAMGSRERTRGALNIAGTRPAGIYTAGAAQNFMNLKGQLPGKKIVMMGSGDIGLIMARRLLYEGAQIIAVYNRSSFSGGLKRNIVQCLDDYGIPLIFLHTITSVYGKDRLCAVGVSKVDPQTKQPIAGTEEYVECDTLLISAGLLPENELTREAGIELDSKTGGAIVDENLQTSMPGVFSAGNVLHIHDLVDFVSEEGLLSGQAAARFIKTKHTAQSHSDNPSQGQRVFEGCQTCGGTGVGAVVPQWIEHNAQGNIALRFRPLGVFEDSSLLVCVDGKELLRKKRKIMVPAEMETVVVDACNCADASILEVSIVANKHSKMPRNRVEDDLSSESNRKDGSPFQSCDPHGQEGGVR